MPITDADRAIAAAAAQIDWGRPVIIQTDLTHVIGLIGLVQLSLRHPEARKTPTAQLIERFILDLIEKVDPEHGEVWVMLQRGFNPNWDL